MKRPGFAEGVLVALAGAVAAGAAWPLLLTLLTAPAAARVLLAMLAGGYLGYLVVRGRLRVGRVTAVAGWCGMSALLAVLDPPLAVHVLAHGSVVWLVRSLAFHRGVIAPLADAGLLLLGAAAGGWAMWQTHSPAMAAWCLLLVQAAFPRLPRDLRRPAGSGDAATHDDRFDRAHRAAETALARLASHR